MNNNHVHHDLIVAWAKGETIEFYNQSLEKWEPTEQPFWKKLLGIE